MYHFETCLFSTEYLTDLVSQHVCSIHTHTPYQVAQLGEKRFENPQTANLHQILVDCLTIHELMVEREREGEGEEEGAGRRRRKSTREKLVSATNQIFPDGSVL